MSMAHDAGRSGFTWLDVDKFKEMVQDEYNVTIEFFSRPGHRRWYGSGFIVSAVAFYPLDGDRMAVVGAVDKFTSTRTRHFGAADKHELIERLGDILEEMYNDGTLTFPLRK